MSAAFPHNDDAFARQHRREVIRRMTERMKRDAIAQPMRLEFERLPSDDTFTGIKAYGKSGNIWFVDPEPGSKRTSPVKVERIRDTWTCSHQGWKAKEQCIHIARVRHMLGEDGVVPYDGRRRRPVTATLYAAGRGEAARRARARAAEPTRVPELTAQLCCEFTEAPSRSETHPENRGANGSPYAYRAYALLRKVFGNISYEQLAAQIGQDKVLAVRLGYSKDKVPERKTFMRWFGDWRLTPILERLFIETTRPTRRFDSMIVGDSHDIPTRMVDNSRDRKFGPKPAKYRNQNRELVRQHFVIGKVSGIIYAADTTLRNGIGTHDGLHLPSLLRQTKERTERVTKAAFDGAYGSKPNFAVAENLGIDLYVHEKQGENRLDSSWPEMARRLAELERTDLPGFSQVQRFRSKAENPPSRAKARNPFMRLRRRKGDPVPVYPAGIEEKTISNLPQEVQDAIFDAARKDVGIARLNESWAILIVLNLRMLNTAEHLYDQRVEFDAANPVTLNPPIEMSERDLLDDDVA